MIIDAAMRRKRFHEVAERIEAMIRSGEFVEPLSPHGCIDDHRSSSEIFWYRARQPRYFVR